MLNLIKLENRIVLDGAAVGEAVDHADDMEAHGDTHAHDNDAPEAEDHSDQVAAAAALLAEGADASEPVDVILIADSLPDYQTLVEAADPEAVVIVYDADGQTAEDVLGEVVAQVKSEGTVINSLTILSHGGSGFFTLGSDLISSENISDHTETLTALKDSMSDNSNIYIFGCNVAEETGSGHDLLNTIAEATGSVVHASDDTTGIQGDWVLEVKSDNAAEAASTEPPFDSDALENYQANLTTTFYPLSLNTLEDAPSSFPIFIYGEGESENSRGAADVNLVGDWDRTVFANVTVNYEGWVTDRPRFINGETVDEYHLYTVNYDLRKDINDEIIKDLAGADSDINLVISTVGPKTAAISITPVNDAPEFNIPDPSITVKEDSGQTRLPGFATDIRRGPTTATDEVDQNVEFHILSNSNPGLFTGDFELTPTGMLIFTPAPDAYGEAKIEVYLEDDGGTQYEGENLSETKEFTIKIDPVIDIEVPTEAPPYIENAPPTAIAPGFDFVNEDPTQMLSSATIRITQNYQNTPVNPGESYTPYAGNDELDFSYTANGKISGNFDSGSGTLVLTGNATVQDYRQAIRSVTVEHTGGYIDPDPGSNEYGNDPLENRRTVSFQVTDVSGNDSNVVTTDVFVDAINDDPDLTTTSTPLTYTEGDPATRIDPNISLFDVDDAVMTGATVQITGGTYVNGEDVLGFNDFGGITGQWNVASGTLVLSGTATKEQYEAALSNVTYRNSNDLNPAEHDRQVTFTVFDNNSRGVGNGPGGDALPGSDSAIRMIDIITENDPPEVDLDENNDGGDPNDGIPGISPDFETTYTENGPAVTIGDIDAIVTDPDSNFLGCNSSGIGMTATIRPHTFHGGDTLTVDVSGSISAYYDPQTGVLTLSGQGTTQQYTQVLKTIRFEIEDDPNTLDRDEANHPYTNSRIIDVQAFDEECAASDVVTSTIKVNPVNDAPVLDLSDLDGDGDEDPVIARTEQERDALIEPIVAGFDEQGNEIIWVEKASIDNGVINDDGVVNNGVVYLGDPVHLTDITNNNPGTIQDIDDTNMTRLVVTITTGRQAGDTLLLNGNEIPAGGMPIPGTSIRASYNSATYTLTLESQDQDSITVFENALNSIQFDTTSKDPTTREITFVVSDDSTHKNDPPPLESPIATAYVSIRLLGIETPETAQYIENCNPVKIAPNAEIKGIVDETNDYATGLVVTISEENYHTEDLLGVALTINGDNIADTNIQIISNQDGALVLEGRDTIANYKMVLRNITYQNISDDPSESDMTERKITYNLTGTENRVAEATSTVEVYAVNDAPENIFPNQVATSPETTVAIEGLSISDKDVRDGIIDVSLTSAESGTIEIIASVPGVTINGNRTDAVQLSGDIESVNEALRNVQYTPFNNFVGNDVITIRTSDNGNTGIAPAPDGYISVDGNCTLNPNYASKDSTGIATDDFIIAVVRSDNDTPVTPPETPDVPFTGISRPEASGMGGIELGAVPLPGAVGITGGAGNPMFMARSGPEFFDFCSIEEALRPHLGCRFANTTDLDAKFSSVEWADLGQPRPYLDEEFDLYSRLFIREPGDPGFNVEPLTFQQDLGGLPDQAPAVFDQTGEADFNDMQPLELKQAFFANRQHLDKTGR